MQFVSHWKNKKGKKARIFLSSSSVTSYTWDTSSDCQYDPPNQPPYIALEEAYKYLSQEITKNFCRGNYESCSAIRLPLHPAPRSPQLPSSPLSNLHLYNFKQVCKFLFGSAVSITQPGRSIFNSPGHWLHSSAMTLSSKAVGVTGDGGGRQSYVSTNCIRTATDKLRQAKQMLEESE